MWYYYINSILKGGFLLKNREYRQRSQLYKLRELKRRGLKYVEWKLNKEQLEYYLKYFEVKPYLYAVRTKKFSCIRFARERIVKDLHYAYKKGKRELVRTLSQEEIELLEQINIKYRVVKWRIILNE